MEKRRNPTFNFTMLFSSFGDSSFCAFETATCTATARFTAAVPCKHRFYRSSGEAEFLRRLCRAQSSRATAARGRKKKKRIQRQ